MRGRSWAHLGHTHGLRQTCVEPQPRFRERLARLAALHGWRFVPAAAVGLPPASGTVGLTLSKCSECVSTLPAMSGRYNPGGRAGSRFFAPAVGLAELIANATAGASASLLKLDIEGGEYAVLPRLVTSGALCRLTHLLIEWHLNALPPPQRLGAVAMRHSLDATLRSGCAAPPFVQHHEYEPNNFFLAVPGLDAEARRHTLSFVQAGGWGAGAEAGVAKGIRKWEQTHAVASGQSAAEA